MNELNIPVKTMTLKEITDLLDVRHNDAMKIVEKMAESLEFGEVRKIRSSYKNNMGADLPLDTYELNKRQSIAVSARLNTSLLMRIIDRWQELESKSNLPSNYIEALTALLESEKTKAVIMQTLEHAQNKLVATEYHLNDIKNTARYSINYVKDWGNA